MSELHVRLTTARQHHINIESHHFLSLRCCIIGNWTCFSLLKVFQSQSQSLFIYVALFIQRKYLKVPYRNLLTAEKENIIKQIKSREEN